MSCLEFALLSRSPISLKKTPGRVAETKEEKREREAKRKTKHNNQQDLLASLSGEDTHTCRHAHTHTHTSSHPLQTLWCFRSSGGHCGNLELLSFISFVHFPSSLLAFFSHCTHAHTHTQWHPPVSTSSCPSIHALPSFWAKTKRRAEKALR